MIKSFIYQRIALAFLSLYTACAISKYEKMNYKLDFKTQYNQFFICDKSSPSNTDSDSFWTDEAHSERLAMEEGIIGIGTQCYGHIKGELIVSKAENKQIDYNKYDHIVEGGLEVKSGVLQILDCPNSEVELELKVNPGKYRVRVYSSNLASADIDEDEGDDYYKIEIWPNPDSDIERKVLKQYIPNK